MSDEQVIERELVSENAQEVKLDGSNTVSFPGFPYKFTAIGEQILVALDQYKSGYECARCKGKGKILNLHKDGSGLMETCPVCQGKSVREGGLIIPDTAKVVASSGVVVSMGVLAQERAKEYKLGDRILFSYHAGSLIPNRAGIVLKRMDWYAAWIRVDGADELSAFDFTVDLDAGTEIDQ